MQIVNESSKLPIRALGVIKLSLKKIPEIDLSGIEYLYLRDEMPKADINSPKWHIDTEKQRSVISAVYSRQAANSPAHIVLFINAINWAFPRVFWLTPVSHLYVTRILAHEVGHHLICSRGYVFSKEERYPSGVYEEEMADRYAFEIVSKMKQTWYYRQAEKLMRFVSQFYIESGSEEYKKANYEKAAIFWNKAWSLYSENDELVAWYWEARKKAEEKNSTE